MLGSLFDLAESSRAATSSLEQNMGSTIVDSVTFLPFHLVDQVWDLVFGVLEDLGSLKSIIGPPGPM